MDLSKLDLQTVLYVVGAVAGILAIFGVRLPAIEALSAWLASGSGTRINELLKVIFADGKLGWDDAPAIFKFLISIGGDPAAPLSPEHTAAVIGFAATLKEAKK